MGSEIYSSKIQAAIADFLRKIDSSRNTDNFAPALFSGEFQRKFGTLNFAGLEQVFRRYNFVTYCLAVPIDIAAERMGQRGEIISILPDDGLKILNVRRSDQSVDELLQQIQTVPFTLFMYVGLDAIHLAAQDWGISYDPLVNMVNLQETGVMTPKPGTNFSRMVESLNRSN